SRRLLRLQLFPYTTSSDLEIVNMRIAYQKQLETLLSVDDGVARVMNALRRTGELENTVIFFTCDNGIFHGEHRIPSGKVLLYERSEEHTSELQSPDHLVCR